MKTRQSRPLMLYMYLRRAHPGLRQFTTREMFNAQQAAFDFYDVEAEFNNAMGRLLSKYNITQAKWRAAINETKQHWLVGSLPSNTLESLNCKMTKVCHDHNVYEPFHSMSLFSGQITTMFNRGTIQREKREGLFYYWFN